MAKAPSTEEAQDSEVVGEPRWPMASAVLAAMALTFLLPGGFGFARGALVTLEGVLLLILILGDPGAITRRAHWLRVVGIGLVAVLVLSAAWATVSLIDSLANGGAETATARDLLTAATAVWVSNNIAFALLFWELDGGGAAARAHRLPTHVDLAFPQQMQKHLVPPGWRPQFIDYLYLGFTNALAFSPTDVMPLAPWAKIAMLVQSLVSLLILGLVVARAVNVVG